MTLNSEPGRPRKWRISPTTARAAATRFTCTGSKTVRLSQILFSPLWLARARAVLALTALVLTFALEPFQPLLFFGVLVLYLLYSLVMLMRPGLQAGMLGLAAVFGDTVYLLALASYGTERLSWF